MRITGEEQEQRNRDTGSVVARQLVKMYRMAVDHATRNDIAAAAAAHHELGRDYDGAVAEGLIERIGAEIDQRVDARLGVISRGSDSSAKVSQAGRQQAMWTGAAVGAGMTGIVVLMGRVLPESPAGSDAPHCLSCRITDRGELRRRMRCERTLLR